MDYAQLLNEIKMRSDDEVKVIASQYGIDFIKIRNQGTSSIAG